MTKLHVSKFDVAERQLLLAIRLFFKEEDPVSIHTLSEASSQILYDLRDTYGGNSMFKNSAFIKEEHKKEWYKKIAKSKNFFKHAEKDPNSTHEFNVTINHFSLIDAVNMYETIKKKWVPETLIYTCWFVSKYPNLLLQKSNYESAYKQNLVPHLTSDKKQMLLILDQIKTGELVLPNSEDTMYL